MPEKILQSKNLKKTQNESATRSSIAWWREAAAIFAPAASLPVLSWIEKSLCIDNYSQHQIKERK
jgi:hypothetical protein